jgi:CRISPR/Cas system-associated exonuclease Cas4 (RecB family)
MNFKHVGCDIDYDLETETINGKRFYKTPEGNLYPSVTTITSQHGKDKIIEWRKRVGEEEANRISTKASSRGTRVHKICENYLNNEEDYARTNPAHIHKTMPDTIAMFKSLQPLLDEHVNNIHALEIPLYSHHLKVAGRVDCIAEYDGKLSIIDFKTSGKLKEESWIKGYFMQCSAYAVMYEERTGIPVSQIVIMIAVDSEHPQVFIKKRNDYIRDFISYREAYDAVLID